MAQQTAMQELIQWLEAGWKDEDTETIIKKANQLLLMEKEQSMDLIKQTAMFMGASNFDKEIASMTYEDVYNSYYNK